jgi:hypothetical protein
MERISWRISTAWQKPSRFLISNSLVKTDATCLPMMPCHAPILSIPLMWHGGSKRMATMVRRRHLYEPLVIQPFVPSLPSFVSPNAGTL